MILPDSLLTNKLLVKRFLAAWNGKGWQAEGEQDLPALIKELFQPSFDYREDSALPPTRTSGMGGFYSHGQLVREIQTNRTTFPDLYLEVDLANMVAEEDRVVAWWTVKGVPSQAMLPIPDDSLGQPAEAETSAREVDARGITIASIGEGRISALEMIWSPGSLLQQLARQEPTSQPGQAPAGQTGLQPGLPTDSIHGTATPDTTPDMTGQTEPGKA